MPNEEEFAEYLIKKAIVSHGLVAEDEIGYLRRHQRLAINKKLKELVEQKEIVPVKITGLDKIIFYTTKQDLSSLNKTKITDTVHLLSPFDNVLIQRKRIEQLFNYKYQIECYVPEPKRIFGYFCLPILSGNEFIGRLDPKADRKIGIFYIKNFFLEKPVLKMEELLPGLSKAIRDFAAFNGCDKIVVENTSPKSLIKIFRKEFR